MAMRIATEQASVEDEQSQVTELRSTLELVPSERHGEHLRRAARAAARREGLARYLAGESTPSNFEAMVRVLERDPNTGAEPCEDCDGQGVRQLAPHVVKEFDQRLEDRLTQLELKAKQLVEKRAESAAVRPLTGQEAHDEDRLRQEAIYEAEQLEKDIIKIHDNIERDRRKRLKRSICRTCKGSAKSRRRRREDRPGRPDSMFSTATCPRCIGSVPQAPTLMVTRWGTSAGVARLVGPRRLHDPENPEVYTVHSHPRDDAAADRGDVCTLCVIEQRTPGYVTPITCRPVKRAGDIEEDLELQQVKTIEVNGEREELGEHDLDHLPADDFVVAPPPADDDAAGWLEEVASEDATLAAAIALLAGDYADRACALWPLTTPGRCLAEEAPEHRQGDGYARLLELCEAEEEAERDAAIGRPRRRQLLGAVRREAKALRDRAEARLAT